MQKKSTLDSHKLEVIRINIVLYGLLDLFLFLQRDPWKPTTSFRAQTSKEIHHYIMEIKM
jgi:hypothetical protein